MITIRNKIATIDFLLADGNVRSFPKLVSRAELINDRVVIKDTSRQINDVITLTYQQIANITLSSNAELKDLLSKFLDGGIGSGVSFMSTTTVKPPITLNAATATKIADINDDRLFFEASILPDAADVCVFIRLYGAGQDNLRRGVWVGRYNQSNDVFFRPSWRMSDKSIYNGEISAILDAGTEDIYITEY